MESCNVNSIHSMCQYVCSRTLFTHPSFNKITLSQRNSGPSAGTLAFSDHLKCLSCLIILSPVLSYREEQSLAEEEQKEELEELPINDPGKGHTPLLQFILISFLLIVSSSQKITKAESIA